MAADAALCVHAVRQKNYQAAQAGLLAEVALIFVGVARLTNTFSLASPKPKDEDEEAALARERNSAKWLTRLVLVAAIGLGAILLYAIQYEHWVSGRVATIASVSFMAAGAAWLIGALLGFLFGIPHSLSAPAEKSATTGPQPAAEGTKPKGESPNRYVPSTSLEQISDWLTKIIVGVGLTQLGNIPSLLKRVATYIAAGMGGSDASKAFALGICVYFSVCGFLFGYLWARLYLIQAFRAADDVQVLEAKVNKLETQQKVDAKALAVVNRILSGQANDPPVSEEELADNIKGASVPVKIQIFSQAEKTSANTQAEDYEAKMEGVIAVLKALIATDAKERFHRNHSELSYALRRSSPPDFPGAIDEITKAIRIRDKLGKTGRKFYEFHRARCRIQMDPDFLAGQPTNQATKDLILADLKLAYHRTEKEKWIKWRDDNTPVIGWMQKNGVTESTL